MIRKDEVLLKDICNAPFIDRWFFEFAQGFDGVCFGEINKNPLRWCLIDLYLVILKFVIFPIVVLVLAVPCSAYDAYKMPKKYDLQNCSELVRFDVWLLREIPQH